MLIKGKEGHNMASNGADMQAIHNRWLNKRKSQMAKWLNGFKPKPPKLNEQHVKLEPLCYDFTYIKNKFKIAVHSILQHPCKHCKFEEPCGKGLGEPFNEGFGITAQIKQDRYFYSIVEKGSLDGIIYGIKFCPMCGRKL